MPPSSSNRPKTGSTRRKPCWSCCWPAARAYNSLLHTGRVFMRRLIAGAIILIASIAVTVAQQEPPKPQEQKPEQKQASPPAQGQRGATPAKPIVPLAVSTLLAHPDQYMGEYISLTAPVEQPLTKTTFSVDQDKTKSEKEILIVAPTMTGTVEPNAYVTVLGELVKFDPDEVRKKT